MQLFRKHIIRWVVSFVLVAGMAAHLAIPYSSKAQKAAFAQWLDRNVVANGDEHESDIRTHIRKLPSEHESFPVFIEKASLLVVNHINDFNLPLEQKAGDTGTVGVWLIGKWSQYQDESGSMDALLPETLKPALKWLLHNNPFIGALSQASKLIPQPAIAEKLSNVLFITQNQPIPFLSGISINAP
jgi:hypothetical protein